jgi:hypothetical protein
MNWSTWLRTTLEPGYSDLRHGVPWPMPAQSVVRAWLEDDDYVVDVELRLDDADEPVVTGIAIRRAVPMKPSTSGPRWPEGTELRAVRPRDVKRLPLSQIAKAAATWVSSTKLEPGSSERTLELDKVRRALRPPPTRPRTDPEFYSKLLLVHDELVARGESAPAKQLAAQMGEPVGKVHVWLHRAKRKRASD